jgi:hypothetical protein
MLTEVMQHYGLARPPIDVGFFETAHHAQISRDIKAAIMGGRLIALTAVIGSGKTILSRRLRGELEREDKVIVARSLSVEKSKITMPLLLAALFYDLSTEKTVTISNHSERRERDLQELLAQFQQSCHQPPFEVRRGSGCGSPCRARSGRRYSGAQRCAARREIKPAFRRKLAETGERVRRTLFGLLANFDDFEEQFSRVDLPSDGYTVVPAWTCSAARSSLRRDHQNWPRAAL